MKTFISSWKNIVAFPAIKIKVFGLFKVILSFAQNWNIFSDLRTYSWKFKLEVDKRDIQNIAEKNKQKNKEVSYLRICY